MFSAIKGKMCLKKKRRMRSGKHKSQTFFGHLKVQISQVEQSTHPEARQEEIGTATFTIESWYDFDKVTKEREKIYTPKH